MEKERCMMCGEDAVYSAPETEDPLCEKCAIINQAIAKDKEFRR